MLIDEDASYLAEKMSPLLQYLKNSSVLITGGTGFFGKWLLESILLVNRVYLTDINAYVVTRNSSRFVSEFPEFLNPHINFLTADVSHLKQIPDIDYVIHAATSVNNFRKSSSALETFDTVVLGTKNILELAKGAKLKGFLLVSSGGVYGDQPPELEKISELYRGGPDFFDSKNTYGEAKRIAENLGVIYRDIYSVPVKTARCFSFIGPYLSGGGIFAAESFITNVVKGQDIVVTGDGTPVRSYLYAAELTVWLWTILFKGNVGEVYNVGSEDPVSIGELAQSIIQVYNRDFSYGDFRPQVNFGIKKVESDNLPSRYVPGVDRALSELGLKQHIELDESIRRTFKFEFSCKKK